MTESGSFGGEDVAQRWFPVAASSDAPFRHVAQAKLLGREYAIWRADDGYVNAWENRCLHRGVRLSIGQNEGTELRCTYHGWRYSSRSGGCTYIPAHPADAPAQTICNQTYRCEERHGLIWVTEAGTGELPRHAAFGSSTSEDASLALRALPLNAPASLVLEMLEAYPAHTAAEATGSHSFQFQVADGDGGGVVAFVQPVDEAHCVIRPVLVDAPPDSRRLEVLRSEALILNRFREVVEQEAASRPSTPVIERDILPVLGRAASETSVSFAPSQSRTELRVVVTTKTPVADGVMSFEFAPIATPGEPAVLPTAQPGAHIDVQLPNGLIRQYSLTNRSGDQERYVIGVKLEPESTGGSTCLHETVREGDVLAISAPRNNFPLRRSATRTILIAGGIGLTPLLAMAETLHAAGQPFEFHCFARSQAHLPFASRLEAMGASVTTHLGLDPSQTARAIEQALGRHEPAAHVYLCGPAPMLDAAQQIAADSDWPEDAVHFEYFANTNEVDRSSSFEISLARSSLTLSVGPGETILDVLRSNGVPLDASCQQGACGTCVVELLDGEPQHQDVHLKPSERAAGDRIITCVSRAAAGERLVLDI